MENQVITTEKTEMIETPRIQENGEVNVTSKKKVGMFDKKINFSVKKIISASYIYLVLPIVVFFAGWLKLWFSIPLTLGVLVAMWFAMKSDGKMEKNLLSNEKVFSIRVKDLILVIMMIIVWVWISGIGGFFYQSSDHVARNAILRDLIEYRWPVYYPQYDNAMVYYIAFWLIPAFIGKVAQLIAGAEAAWLVANISLFLLTTLGILLTSLLVMSRVKAVSGKKVLASMLVLIFFSGMDVLGIIITKFLDNAVTYGSHLEWWNLRWQFSSNSTQLFWVFNQSLTTWLVVILFLHQRNVKNFAFLAALMIPYAPLPIYGFAILLAVAGLQFLWQSIREKRLPTFLGECFSIQNILGVICIVPLFFIYFTNNKVVEAAGWNSSYDWVKNPTLVATFIIFLIVEVGAYLVLIFSEHRKNPLWYALLLSFIVIPFIRLGTALDFCMRASLPGLFVLMVYVIEYIFKHTKNFSTEKICTDMTSIALIICLLIGCATSGTEIKRGISQVVKAGTIFLPADSFKTLNRPDKIGNFVCNDPENSSPFFKYFAKELK